MSLKKSINHGISTVFSGLGKATSASWPLFGKIFPENLDLDDNASLWANLAPPYTPAPTLERDIDADIAIIGGGFTGISTAYHFSSRYPDKQIVLLEAKTLGNGATGRGGGKILNWLANHDGCDAEMLARIYRETNSGINSLLDIIRQHTPNIPYQAGPAIEMYTSKQRAEAAHADVEYMNGIGIPARYLSANELKDWVQAEGIHGGTLDPNCGILDGLQFVRALRPVLEARGVKFYENSAVLKVREGSTVTLSTAKAQVRARAIVLASNVNIRQLGYFREAFFPVITYVCATPKLDPQKFQQIGWKNAIGVWDDRDRISYASRAPSGHLIFGGGSNAAYGYKFNSGTTHKGDLPARGIAKIRQTFTSYFPNASDLEITQRWSGALDYTFRRQPLIGVRGENRNVYYAFGYCGHGVTLGMMAGQVLTDLYSSSDERWRGLPFYLANYDPIPPEPFRWLGFQAYTRITGNNPRKY